MTEILQPIAFCEPSVEQSQEAAMQRDRFAGLIERQARFVFRVAYAVLRNHHAADDVVQDTFLKVYRTRKWEQVENERAFLARVAWRIALDRRPRVRAESPGLEIPSNHANPEQAAIATDWETAIHRLIDGLPEELRQCLVLSTVEELKSHEIAAVMGIPEGTVRSRLSRARKILRQKMTAFMGDPHAR